MGRNKSYYLLTLAIAFLMGTTAARANLIGAGNTVNALFYLGAHDIADEEPEINATTMMIGPSPIGTAGTSFLQGVSDGATIDVGTDPGHSQIVITNEVNLPFCTVTATTCPDSFDGFEFIFKGTNITGVSVDPASAADFQPITPPALTAATQDILVDVINDNPAVGDKLILDLQFQSVPAPLIGGGLPIFLVVGGLLFGAKLAERGKKHRSP
jgi:hypothetical protein